MLYIVAGKLASIVLATIHRLTATSYLNLTRGDQLARDELQAANRKGLIKIALSFIAELALSAGAGIATAVVARVIA